MIFKGGQWASRSLTWCFVYSPTCIAKSGRRSPQIPSGLHLPYFTATYTDTRICQIWEMISTDVQRSITSVVCSSVYWSTKRVLASLVECSVYWLSYFVYCYIGQNSVTKTRAHFIAQNSTKCQSRHNRRLVLQPMFGFEPFYGLITWFDL